MSIVRRDYPVPSLVADIERGHPCYYCDQPLTFPAVCWLGTAEIVLHPACVVELSIRLLRDVWQIECQTGADVTSRTMAAEQT